MFFGVDLPLEGIRDSSSCSHRWRVRDGDLGVYRCPEVHAQKRGQRDHHKDLVLGGASKNAWPLELAEGFNVIEDWLEDAQSRATKGHVEEGLAREVPQLEFRHLLLAQQHEAIPHQGGLLLWGRMKHTLLPIQNAPLQASLDSSNQAFAGIERQSKPLACRGKPWVPFWLLIFEQASIRRVNFSYLIIRVQVDQRGGCFVWKGLDLWDLTWHRDAALHEDQVPHHGLHETHAVDPPHWHYIHSYPRHLPRGSSKHRGGDLLCKRHHSSPLRR